MKFYLDTEFAESPGAIKLISIGIAAEDGRTFYAESADFDEAQCNDWVKANVLPHLHEPRIREQTIRDCVLAFVGDEKPEFWGYYCDYDWVTFCWLFGAMIDLPHGWPMYCRDLKQELDRVGNPRVPFRPDNEHHALSDARWNKSVHEWIDAGCPESAVAK